MNIGLKLKELRIANNLTQEELANFINISRIQYNQYENNYVNIPIKHLINISNFYDVSLDYLFNFTNIKQYDNLKKEIDKIKAGERLKNWRKKNKLTQVKLASILNTTFSSIAFNEKGRNIIATPFLYTICYKYKVSAEYLLGRIDNPKYYN